MDDVAHDRIGGHLLSTDVTDDDLRRRRRLFDDYDGHGCRLAFDVLRLNRRWSPLSDDDLLWL